MRNFKRWTSSSVVLALAVAFMPALATTAAAQDAPEMVMAYNAPMDLNLTLPSAIPFDLNPACDLADDDTAPDMDSRRSFLPRPHVRLS